jgi:hypothetical protein
MLSKHEALSSNPNPTKKNKKKRATWPAGGHKATQVTSGIHSTKPGSKPMLLLITKMLL